MFQHDPQHTGRSPHAAPAKLKLAWRFQVKGLPGSPAIGADGTIYLPTGNAPVGTTEDRPGFLYAVNPDGTLRWRYEFPSSGNCVIVPTRTTPAVAADGTIYVQTQSGRTTDGSGYCTAGPSFLFAINPDGTTKWTYQLNFGAPVFSSTDLPSPAVAPDGTIYLTSRDAGLWAINPDGTLKWVVGPEGNSIESSPAIGPDGTVYVNDSDLHAYTPDGVEKWVANTGGATPNGNSPTVAPDGMVYACGINPDRCHAVSPTGNINWSFPLEARTTTPALAADGTIYLVGRTDGLYAVNPDGTQRWHTLFEEPSFGKISHSPVVGADGRLYARDDADVLQGVLYVLNSDGTESDKEQIPAVFPRGPGTGELSPAIGSDGTLYVPLPRAGSGGYDPNDQHLAAYVKDEGGDGDGGGPDTTSPDTRITEHPPKRTTKRRARFEFKAVEQAARGTDASGSGFTFECKFDGRGFKPCSSPKKYRNLKVGRHVFKVRARDEAGNTDSTPAKWRWTVQRR